jgi:hypothetical protein
MQWITFVTAVVLIGGVDDQAPAFRFTKDDAGKVPAGWKVAKTGRGEGSAWQVVQDETAPSKSGYVLAQTAESPNNVFNLCVADGTRFKDVELEVAFKAIRGNNDQGGGFVWRYKDPNNYYICRMNPLEDNYRVYKVVAGKRTQLGGKEGIRVPAGEWHRLRVIVKGDHMEGYLDGQKEWEINDTTYEDAGQVGLWSKSDAQTHFDGFQAKGN